MKHIPRFFTDTKLFAGFIADLSQEQRHHVFCVLRMEENEILNLFNPIDGEWECRIIDKKKGKVECEKQIRKCSENEDGAIVACAVIQPNNMSWMLEKITELGVSEIIPIITQYTNFRNFNENDIVVQVHVEHAMRWVNRKRNIECTRDGFKKNIAKNHHPSL